MTWSAIQPQCPLCNHPHTSHYDVDKQRAYWQCQQCQLVFVDRADLPDASAEKAVYDCHQNDLYDAGYRGFLSRVAKPLSDRLQANLTGLDFGCGPGPALAAMLEEQGHQMSVYDPFFAPNQQVLEHQYDFVTCTEAIEHFHYPQQEWQQLLGLLKPGGWLAIMTKLVASPERFANWHYKLDPTHVSFFSSTTFEYLAARDQLTLEFIGTDVMIMQKANDH